MATKRKIKISKSKIITLLIFIGIICLDWFILEPEIKKTYLNHDIWDFENNSWQYCLITFFLIYISLVLYKLIKSKYKKSGLLVVLIYLSLPSAFFALSLTNFTENITLYINSFYHNGNLKKEYLIQRYEKNKVFHLYDNDNEIIFSERELNKINEIRKSKNLVSLYSMKNNDTIIISYRIGFLETKYLKK